MTKKHTTLTIDNEIIEALKEKGHNMSELAELAFRAKLGKENVEVDILGDEKCFKCGREERKATNDNLDGLTWLWPDEIWICNRCLRKISNRGIAR